MDNSVWSNPVMLERFIKISQRWVEKVHENSSITEEIVNEALAKAQMSSADILTPFTEKLRQQGKYNDDADRLLQSWIEVGLVGGYLAGELELNRLLERGLPKLGWVGSETTDISAMLKQGASDWAVAASTNIFTKLSTEPVNPLIRDMGSDELEILRLCLESSLFQGLLNGAEAAYQRTDVVAKIPSA